MKRVSFDCITGFAVTFFEEGTGWCMRPDGCFESFDAAYAAAQDGDRVQFICGTGDDPKTHIPYPGYDN